MSSFGSTSSSTSNSNSPAVRSGGGEECDGGGGGSVRLHDVNVVLSTVDSIGSDVSLPSPSFSPQNIVYQDASGFIDSKPVLANNIETETNCPDRSPRTDLLNPVSVPGYIINKPMGQPLQPTAPPQPQYYHPATKSSYVSQCYTNHVPVASYPTVYQPYAPLQQPAQYQINKPYPVYMTPYGQTQNPYDMSAPSVTKDLQVPSNPVLVPSSVVYEGYKPAIPAQNYAAKVYTTPAVVTPPSNVLASDHQQQAVGFLPVGLPSQPVADYKDPLHAQAYKTQPPGPALPSQLQTAAIATTPMLSEAITRLHVDNTH